MEEHINYYDLLGVPKTATSDEIKRAYRKQMMAWHPDKNKSSNASEISAKLNEAKEILLDESKRKKYDEKLENTKKKVYENVSSNKNEKTTKKTKQKPKNEEKSYTKWQYFILYLKHYNVPLYRKIIAFVLVIIETFICFILEAINIIISYLIYYSYDVLYSIGIVASIYFFIKGGIQIGFNESFELNKVIIDFLLGLVILITSVLLIKIYEITVVKIPILISKLNMFLFKKSIGYK